MNSSLKRLALLAAILVPLCPAYAQIDNWTGGATPAPANQDWTNGGNWSLGAPPTAGQVPEISISATITLPSASTTVAEFGLEKAPITLNGTAFDFNTGFLAIFGSATATLNLATGGSFNVADDENYIGSGQFGSASLTVNGSGLLSFTDTNDALYIGAGGTGTLTQTGGTVSVTGTLILGSDFNEFGASSATGTGVYNLSGTGTLNVGQLNIGNTVLGNGTAASGTFNMSGGQVIAGTTDLGVSGGGLIANDIGDIEQTGGSFTSTIIDVGASEGAVGIYNLSGTGTLSADAFIIAGSPSSSGTFTQSGASSTSTFTEMFVGEDGNGTFNMQGGLLTISSTGDLTLGNFFESNGVLNQSGGTITLADITTTLIVGNIGTGNYNLSGGELDDNGSLDIGNGNGTGTFTLSGSGDLVVAFGVVVGNSGTGVFNYDGGTIDPTTAITVTNLGVFNQRASLSLSTLNQITLDSGSNYNLISGTLSIGGDMTGGTSGINATAGANFNFEGGTVQTTSAWTDSLGGAVIGNSTINTSGGTAVLSGALTGGGTLIATGGGLLDITGVSSSSATWNVEAANGTISAAATTFPSQGNILIDSTGIVDLGMGTAGTHALGGSISGSGSLHVNFLSNTDVLQLTGDTDFSGVTTLAGNGTLEAANGSFGQITGAGAMTIGGPASSGVVTFTNGNNNYTGATTIDSGYTLYASSLQGGGTVTNNGILGVQGVSGHSTGSGVLSISGPFVSNGNILIGMSTTPSTDVIHVNNTANVTGSTFTLVNAQPVTGTFTILTSTGLTANNVTLESNLFIHASVAPDTINPNNLDLFTSTTTSSGIAGLSLTPNQQAAASAIDPLIGNTSLSSNHQANLADLLNLIGANGTSTGQLAKNYEQLTPESLQYAQAIAYEHSAFLVSKVDGFDDALHHEFSGFDTGGVTITLPGFNSGLGREMQSMLAYDPSSWHPTAPNGVNYYPDDGSGATGATITPASPEPGQVMSDSPTTAPMPVRTEPHSVVLRKPYSNFSAFIGGDGTIADLNQDQGASYAPSSKASYSSEDAIAGVSYRMTNKLAAGVLMDYSHTDATTDSYGSKTRVDTYSPGVFATYGDKGFYINGLFSYGRNNYTNSREVPVVGGAANSSPDGNQYTAALDAGYQLNLGQGLTLTPSGGLTYTHLDIDSFTETGAAPANLAVDAQHDDSLRSRLGASVQYLTGIGRITLIPTLTALWQHEFLDENAPITSSFNDIGSGAFTIHSVSMGRDSALIGVGLTAHLDNSMAIFVEANADVNENYYAENFIGGFKGSF